MIKKIKIQDIGKIITGNTPPRSNPELYGTFIPFIKATDIIESSKFTYYPEEGYSELGFQKYQNSLICKGATCVVTIGSVGKKLTMAHCDCFINQAMNAVIPNDNYDDEYIYYLLKNNIYKLKMLNSGTASGRENISKSAFSNMEIEVILDKEKQIIIGKILSTYDDLIENNKKQIKLLEEAAQRLYKEWFVDLHFPGYETTPIIDGVPEGWRKSFVGECAIILRRGISPAYHENGKFTVINQKCIRQTVVDFDEARKQEKAYSDDLNLLDSDTVICSTGAGTLGRVGQIFGNHPKTTFDSHITLVRANEMIGKQYLFHVLKSYQNYLMGMGKGSTNQLELSRNTIQELTVYVPTFELKIKFEALVQPIHDKISLLNKKIKYLYEARDRLLPKLMSGELEV